MTMPTRAPSGLTEEDRQLLARVPLLRGLDAEARAVLTREGTVRRYPRGATLFIQGDPAEAVFIILQGWIKLFRTTADGAESVIAVFSRGESFAEAAIFDRSVYPVSSMAIEDSRLLLLPAGPFIARLEENSAYALAMMASMSSRLRRLVQQVEQLTVRSSTERLAAFLLSLCQGEAGSATVHLPLEKALIAGRLGMQPETFSRALAKLKRHGVICRGNEVTLQDVARLRRLGEQHSF